MIDDRCLACQKEECDDCIGFLERFGHEKGEWKAAVEAYDINTGRVIERFESMTAAAKEIEVTRDALSKAVKNGRPCKGFYFRRIEQRA